MFSTIVNFFTFGAFRGANRQAEREMCEQRLAGIQQMSRINEVDRDAWV